MKQTILLLTLFCILTVLRSNAQKDFLPGYIITLENDTVSGTINLGTSIQNSQKCIFRNIDSKNNQELYPFDIKAYVITGKKHFISKQIPLNDTTQNVFLEYLVDGIVDLYFIKHEGSNYYYVEKEGKMYQLSNDEIKTYPNGRLEVKPSEKYKGILSFLFQDDPKSRKKALLIPYSNKSLIRFTKDYHNKVCTDYECIDYTKNVKSSIYLEPVIGGIFSRIKIAISNDYTDNKTPAIGCNLRIIPSTSLHLINYNISLLYSYTKINKTYTSSVEELFYHVTADGIEKIIPRTTYPANVSANYSFLNVPLILEYNIPLNKKIQPTLFTGLSNSIIFYHRYSVSYIRVTHDKYFHPIYTEFFAEPKSSTYHMGVMAGIGFRYFMKNTNYFFIKGQYEYRVPFISREHFLDYQRINSVQLFLGYGFKI
ncbi:hypothetical protein ACE01N_08805 [Saccharicrinis sp. FJH2]|uniref:hypothetical protein n=1 Tax=Saccharicrinis sp. FJH65 TaxID=3344659 RepID=UPI0035F39FF6